ncbi:MAG TPA: hypothetical protein VFR84_11880 [Candidatus Angelobacter sp.]|nr:hypothetical protein [Candidatus Angelobacter sp.]
MRARIFKLALLCALVSSALFGFYQKRKPTPEEEKAIAKYTTVMDRLLNQFRGPDWDETIDAAIDHPMINIMDDRPFDIDQVLVRTYHVRPDSRRYQTLIAPKLQKVAQLKDASARDLERARAEDLKHLQVQVHFNMWVVPMITPPDPKKDPKIPGATFVHHDRDNPFNHGVAYVLFFSNGRVGRWDETNSVYRNVFIHKPGTPYIENLEIRIYGAEDRIRELLRKIDWKQVNAALTQ